MTMISQIANACKTSTLHLRNIVKIRKYLSTTAFKCILHSFVTSRLDSNNALLYNIPNCLLQKLQRVQNWAAKVIVGGKKYDHVSLLLKELLHRLPVVKQVQLKILLLCYRCLNRSAPRYLTSLLSPHKPPRNLRSSRDVLKLNVLNGSEVIVPFLWHHLTCGIICPTKSGPHLRLTFSNPY